MTQSEKDYMIQRQREIILRCEANLRSKDYIGTKIAMGVATKKEYEDEIAKTEQWRSELNAALEEIARLEAVETEEEEVVPVEEV